MRLLIVIVNYRTPELTVDCLRSLAPQIADGMRVVITDNLSGDDSIEKIGRAIDFNDWKWAALIELHRNGGFAFGNNAAIETALKSGEPPEYVLLLNPDTVLQDDAIEALLDYMDRHKDVGIAGSRLEDPDGTPQISAFRFHTIASEFERGLRLGIVTKLLSKRIVTPPVPTTEIETDWVAGASMIIRREVFEKIGLFDEKYFMYFEEVDFCLKAKRAGFKIGYVPSSRVVHLVGAASELSDARKHRKRRPTYWFDSRRRYFVKNHGVALCVPRGHCVSDRIRAVANATIRAEERRQRSAEDAGRLCEE